MLWIILSTLIVGVQQQPTAEDLLEALRRKRPSHAIIQPASAKNRLNQAKKPLLLPGGTNLVNHIGELDRDGFWWTFVPDGKPAGPPLKLLPNAYLEVMIRIVAGANEPVRFAISGYVTVFKDENYLFVNIARRTNQPLPPIDPAEKSQSPEARRTSSSGNKPDSRRSPESLAGGSENEPVEDVLALLQGQKPNQPVLPFPKVYRQPRDNGLLGAPTLRREGSIIVRRTGRLFRGQDWWLVAFESDHPDEPEPPIRLLPNKNVELMIQAHQREPNGLVFLVTGDVTRFEGQNYLLPRLAIRRIDMGNLTK